MRRDGIANCWRSLEYRERPCLKSSIPPERLVKPLRNFSAVLLKFAGRRAISRRPPLGRPAFRQAIPRPPLALAHSFSPIQALDYHVRSIACRSEEHTSELQSLMRISYAVFCLKKKNNTHKTHDRYQ